MKKKKLIKELAKAREELRRMRVRYNTSMDKFIEAQLANPYVFVPPRSVKIADEMKNSTGKAEIARALMGSHDPKGE